MQFPNQFYRDDAKVTISIIHFVQFLSPADYLQADSEELELVSESDGEFDTETETKRQSVFFKLIRNVRAEGL